MKNKIYSSQTFQTKAKEIAFESLFNLFHINFSWMDVNGYVLGCNQNVLNSQKISSFTDIIGKHTTEVASKLAWENTQKVIETGESSTFEETHTFEDGSKVYFLSMKTPMRDCKENVIGVVNLAIDITQRKSMEENLKQLKEAAEVSDKIKTDFLTNIRHDLKTPLSGIVTISELLEKDELHSSKKNYLKDIKKCAESMIKHLNSILDHVNVESGEFSVIEKEFDINSSLQHIYRILLPSTNAKGIEFTLTLDNLPHLLIGDAARTERILINIISNAIKFTEKGYVKVTVTWFPKSGEDGTLQFIVEDTGIGIPEDKTDMIFEKFYRLNPSYEGNYSGNGLGLNIVRHIVEELKGSYEVKSTLGKGTSFIVILPYKVPVVRLTYDKTSVNTNPVPIPNQNLSTKKLNVSGKLHKVLLVEDNNLISRVSKDLLEKLNCEVDIAATGKSALELVNQFNYDLVFMDIGLPDIDGYTVTERIRLNQYKDYSTTPIIAVTAHESDETGRSIEAGISRFITKPLTYEIAESILSHLS